MAEKDVVIPPGGCGLGGPESVGGTIGLGGPIAPAPGGRTNEGGPPFGIVLEPPFDEGGPFTGFLLFIAAGGPRLSFCCCCAEPKEECGHSYFHS